VRAVPVWKLVIAGFIGLAAVSGCGGGGGSNPNPVLGTTSFSTLQNVALHAQLTATDPGGGALTFAKTGNPASGVVSGFTSAGAFVYTPNATFTGNDGFSISVTDAAGHSTSGSVAITVKADHAPVAGNVIVRADGSALAKVNALANTTDQDNDKLTVTIDGTPFPAGTKVTVNADQTVSISALPSDFKGLTTFAFTATDPSGMTSKAAAAVFVGTDPFRAAFVADASASGAYEVYQTDFAAAPVAISSATHGTTRLQGFAVADTGKTVVYRSKDSATGTSTLSFVQTATPATQVAITLPAGSAPVQDAQGADQFRVSPDGQWIAAVAGQGNASSLYVLNVAKPTVVTALVPSASVHAEQVSFTPDSKGVYFLSSSVAPGSSGATNRSLYFVDLAVPGTLTLMSVLARPSTADDVQGYEVSQDQTRIGLVANRSGSLGLFFVDPAHPAAEAPITPTFGTNQVLYSTTLTLPPGSGGGGDGLRVGYTTWNTLTHDPSTLNAYVAEVSAKPNPRAIPNAAAGGVAIAVRPDDAAILYSKASNIYENLVDSNTTDASLGGGTGAWYDSTGNIVLLSQATVIPGTSTAYPVLASTTRSVPFTQPQLIDGGDSAVDYTNITGFDRAVAVIAEGPTSGAAPSSAVLKLVNALAPASLLPLSPYVSPLKLSTDVARITN
jgi:hypothetical protein